MFDLNKFLTENKLTKVSKALLKESEYPKEIETEGGLVGFFIGEVEGTPIYSVEDSSVRDTMVYVVGGETVAIEVDGEMVPGAIIYAEYGQTEEVSEFLAQDIANELGVDYQSYPYGDINHNTTVNEIKGSGMKNVVILFDRYRGLNSEIFNFDSKEDLDEFLYDQDISRDELEQANGFKVLDREEQSILVFEAQGKDFTIESSIPVKKKYYINHNTTVNENLIPSSVKKGKIYIDDEGTRFKIISVSGNKVKMKDLDDDVNTTFPDDFDEGAWTTWFTDESTNETKLTSIVKEVIQLVKEASNVADNPYYDEEFRQAESLLLKGLTQVLGNKAGWVGETDDGELYAVPSLVDRESEIYFAQERDGFYIGVTSDSGWFVKPTRVELQNITSTTIALAKKYRDKLASQQDSADGEDEISDADEAQRLYHNKMVKLGHRKGPIFSKKNFKQNYQDYIAQVRTGTSPYYS